MKTSEILETFWEAEQDAGQWLKESLPIISKVVGSYMVDVAFINKKLIKRAQSILGILFNMDKAVALLHLKKADMNLSRVICLKDKRSKFC
jgi:N-acetylmuramic acid 6-phosphate (MurNAc-6-P) etherase